MTTDQARRDEFRRRIDGSDLADPVKAPAEQPLMMTRDEWRAEATRRFGAQFSDWTFQCPICKRVFSVSEFEQHAGRDKIHRAYQECIGRVNGLGFKAFKESALNTHGCDYAAYGLFCSQFQVVDQRVTVRVLPFATPESNL